MAYIGIDLGGTKTDIAVVDAKGTITKNRLIPTKRDPSSMITDIVLTIQELGSEDVAAIGVGMAAQIEKGTGIVQFAPNLGWHDLPLQQELSSRLQLPTWITNDVRAATWGEWLFGAGVGCKDLVCVFVGTGIGGGIVCDGHLLEGSNNTAGEIGHMTLALHGPLCSCGNHGCFEAFAGGWAIAKRAKDVIAYDHAGGQVFLHAAECTVEQISAKHVFMAYHRHVPLAIKVIEEVKEALIAGAANLINGLSPARLILGGGVLHAEPELIEVIRQGVPKRALKAAMKNVEIVEAQLKNKAGVIGAAAFAMRMEEGNR